MGFFKKLVKGVGKLVSNVGKVAGAVAGVVPGGTAAANLLEKAGNLAQTIDKSKPLQTAKQLTAVSLPNGKTVTTTVKQAVVATQNKAGFVARTGKLNLGQVLTAAAGGALAGAGVAIGGSEAGNAAVNATGWTAAKTWLKNNWYWPVAAIAAVIAAVVYFKKRGKGKKGKLW